MINKKYNIIQWQHFKNRIRLQRNNVCNVCGKFSLKNNIQCLENFYHPEKEIWEYKDNEIRLVCFNCGHKNKRDIELKDGWTLISINDLGYRCGRCEKIGKTGNPCNQRIMYEHTIVHPKFYGSKIVGSTCVEYLTKKSIDKVEEYKSAIKKISNINKKTEKKEAFKSLNKIPWIYFCENEGRKSIEFLFDFSNKNKELLIISDIKEKNGIFWASLEINYIKYNFLNKKTNKKTNEIYGDFVDIKKMLLLIKERQLSLINGKEVIALVMSEELKTLLKNMNFKILKES